MNYSQFVIQLQSLSFSQLAKKAPIFMKFYMLVNYYLVSLWMVLAKEFEMWFLVELFFVKSIKP